MDKIDIDEQISRLKAEKSKKDKGEKYSVADALNIEKKSKVFIRNEEYVEVEKKIEKETEKNPFVRRITIDELINVSREKQGKPPIEPQKKVPFISKSKEIKTPTLQK